MIKNDGKFRYFGQFKENKMHGRGTLYEEHYFKETQEILSIIVYKGGFCLDQFNGKVKMQIFEPEKSSTLIKHFD